MDLSHEKVKSKELFRTATKRKPNILLLAKKLSSRGFSKKQLENAHALRKYH